MATERQIAANRRNARRSTGPRSGAGKRRASRNALRHGLSVASDDLDQSDDARLLLARLVGDSRDEGLLEAARATVRAHLELVRVRQVKANIINMVTEFGRLKAPPPFYFRTVADNLRYICAVQPFVWPPPPPADPMPSEETERAAEAVRRLLPELRKLNQYEARAFSAKDRALREVSRMRSRPPARER